jgi:hypothetical protein
MRGVTRTPLCLAILIMLSLSNCAPADVSNCSVTKTANGAYVATLTLSNHSSLSILKSTVLIDASHLGPRGGHRLFDTVAPIGPGQSRLIRGVEKAWPFVVGGEHPNDWSFKDAADERSGCELDHVDFADGTDWEHPSPL